MSIETLLEAAKFLELQAQQQQKAREDELKEKLRLLQKTEFIYQDVGDGLRVCPAPVPPPLPPPSTPLTVTPNPSLSPALPVTARSPPAVPSLASPLERSSASTLCSPPPKTDHATATVTTNHRQNHYHHSPPTDPTSNTKPLQQLIQCYPGPVLPVLQPAAPPNGPVSLDSPPDDGRQLDNKKRPGGAGTREVHNKLEKHRRAHLKECFEMLKKNIPNIDEKKTSNLSVLRSALRYIQTLKRKEKEYEHDMERLAREKIATQQRLAELKNDLSQWMDVMEIERILRQTVQPEDDQASTSTASEGEDAMEDEADRETTATPTAPHNRKPEQHKTETHSQPPAASAAASIVTQHVSAQNKPPVLHPAPPLLSKPAAQTAATPTQPAAAPNLHPTVIAHASVSHPSVIQAVNHVIHRTVPKHLTPSSHQAISHFTVHPMANLSQHIPALYSQPVVGHITHTLNHAHPHVNSTSPTQAAATLVSKHGAIGTQMITHSPQLMGQAVLNPVTMVTMPSFPISTLKLA